MGPGGWGQGFQKSTDRLSKTERRVSWMEPVWTAGGGLPVGCGLAGIAWGYGRCYLQKPFDVQIEVEKVVACVRELLEH